MRDLTKEELFAFERFVTNKSDVSAMKTAYAIIFSNTNNWISSADNKYIQQAIADYLHTNRALSTKENIKFTNIIKEYESIVQKTALLAKTLDITDEVVLYFFTYYLIFNNYFSINRGDVKANELFISEHNGIIIMLGSWCCRHSTDFIQRILVKTDPQIKNISIATKKKNPTNHAALFTKKNDKYYVLDSTSPFISQVQQDCTILSPHGLGEIRLGSLLLFDYNHANLRYVLNAYKEIRNGRNWQCYTPFTSEHNEAKHIMLTRKRELRDFQEDIAPSISKMKEEKKILENQCF